MDAESQQVEDLKAEIARLKRIVARQKEALERWADSCTCEQRAREVSK